MLGYFMNRFIDFYVAPMPMTLEDSLAIAKENNKLAANAMVNL